MELVCGAVQVVRPRPGRDDDLAPGLSSVLGRVGPGQHLELAHGVQDRPVQRLVGGLVVVVDPVLDVVVGDLAVAGHVEAAAEPEGGVLRGSEDVGLKLGELQVVPAVERQLDDLLLVDHGSPRRRLGLEQRRGPDDLDDRLDGPELEREVDPRHLVDLQGDPAPHRLLEALLLDRHLVGPGLEAGQGVGPARARLRPQGNVRCDARDHHRGLRHPGARLVPHVACEGGGVLLGVERARGQQEAGEQDRR